jgi:hypothetical protein
MRLSVDGTTPVVAYLSSARAPTASTTQANRSARSPGTHGATYWIQNTLTNTVQPREMLAIAEQTQPVVSPRASASLAGAGASIPTPQAVQLPPCEAAPLSLAAKLGALLGFVGLAVVALLALLVLYRRRELIGLREQVASALALEASRRAQLLERGPQR